MVQEAAGAQGHDGCRGPTTENGLDPLSQEWPTFLDLLSSDPGELFRRLHGFIHRLLGASPPAIFAALPKEDREEMPGQILLHLCGEDFRRLRTYRARGVPFAHWLIRIASNMARDMIDKNQRERRRRQPLDPGTDGIGDDPVVLTGESRLLSGRSPEKEALLNRLLDRVFEAIQRMDRKCQLLLLGSAHELSPKELAWLMGWPSNWNVKASDDRRYCRSKLRDLLVEKGVDLGTIE
jgi:DNA-directed RNA polymerase specialized sigma24 family protein